MSDSQESDEQTRAVDDAEMMVRLDADLDFALLPETVQGQLRAIQRDREAHEHRAQLAEQRVAALKEALLPFAEPSGTISKPDYSLPPEREKLAISVTTGDWLRACLLLGQMDTAYLQRLPENIRPTPGFIRKMRKLERLVSPPPKQARRKHMSSASMLVAGYVYDRDCVEVLQPISEDQLREIERLLGAPRSRFKEWSKTFIFEPVSTAQTRTLCRYLADQRIRHALERRMSWSPPSDGGRPAAGHESGAGQ